MSHFLIILIDVVSKSLKYRKPGDFEFPNKLKLLLQQYLEAFIHGRKYHINIFHPSANHAVFSLLKQILQNQICEHKLIQMAYKYNYSIKLTISGHLQSLLSSAGILLCCVDGKQEKQKIVGNVMFTLLRARTLFNFLNCFFFKLETNWVYWH